MAGYNNAGSEHCRFCGYDLPVDAVAVMSHYNNHWRQYNIENLSLNSCAFEPQLDVRIAPTSINPDDLEVCSHLQQNNFQYSYSPQTEPSNLSITGARCSPLNLTGRPKSESPLISPLSSPMPNEAQHHGNQSHTSNPMNITSHPQSTITNLSINPDLSVPQSYSIFPPQNMFPSCSGSNLQVMNPMQMNEMNNINIQMENSVGINFNAVKKRKRTDRPEFFCPLCSRNLCTKTMLDEHLQLCHSKDSTLPQNYSNFIINNDPVILNHSTQTVIQCPAVPIKPYKCSICDHEFNYKEELVEHMNNHEASKPYKCEICGVGLSHISALKRHTLTHSGHKPHTCDVCGRGFFQRCDLYRHTFIHRRKKEVVCNNCKKTFYSNFHLKSHKCKPPEEPKPFKCSICGEGCSTNVTWSYHMWKHTKNPMFVPCQPASKLGNNILSSTVTS